MGNPNLHVVTGAFGYTGRYIARRLLAKGHAVRTLTGHPKRPDPFGGRLSVSPLAFDAPSELVRSLQGATVLYNTYWIRFAREDVSFETAIRNTRILLRACEEAGVRRVVHISISNPSDESPLPYYRGKATVERMIRSSRLSYAILRPTVIFGAGDILINNMAWFLRRFLIFAMPASRRSRLQPVYVDDLANLAVETGAQKENTILDTAGPETYFLEELVRLIHAKIGSRARIVNLPTEAVRGLLTGDVGRAIGKAFVTLGHDVKMGSRSATNVKAVAWAKETGAMASVGTFADAASYGEIVVLATLGAANESALRSAGLEKFRGKVVIDTTNPLDFSSGMPPKLAVAGNDSAGERVQRLLPDAHVVKAFNTVGSAHMFRPSFPGGPPDMFICGDHDGAKQTVGGILSDFGWGVVDIGGVESSRYLEAMCLVWVLHGARTNTWNHAFKLLRR